MQLADLDFHVPEELIAQRPTPERDACRLLCLDRRNPAVLHEHIFRALPDLLRPEDVLVRNVTRVIPARLHVVKDNSGGGCELLLLEPAADGTWWILARPARRLKVGSSVHLGSGIRIEVRELGEAGRRRVAFPPQTDVLQLADEHGKMPLPPYIRRQAAVEDAETYQTVFARVSGSVAAPTAGLHFTRALLERLEARGIAVVDIVLHVGPGTFEPVRTMDPLQHRMHWESFEATRAALKTIEERRASGGRVVAVGSTVSRLLESLAAHESGAARGSVEVEEEQGLLRGRTRLFIHPPYVFRRVDVLLTNFHLPRSTLLLLVDAFADRAAIRAAYAHAVQRRFRFFSYGDAMLIE